MRHSTLETRRMRRLGGAFIAFGCGLTLACSLTIDEDALRGGDGSGGNGNGQAGSGPTEELECSNQEKECEVDGVPSCVGFDDPEYGCSSVTCTPCNLQKATARCSPASGRCVVAVCIGTFRDCDGADDTGCEIDVSTNTDHCGACTTSSEDNRCPEVDNAEIGCGSGECFILVCDSGFGDCNDDYDDGCETDLTTSSEHCGECGMPCAGTCVAGECES